MPVHSDLQSLRRRRDPQGRRRLGVPACGVAPGPLWAMDSHGHGGSAVGLPGAPRAVSLLCRDHSRRGTEVPALSRGPGSAAVAILRSEPRRACPHRRRRLPLLRCPARTGGCSSTPSRYWRPKRIRSWCRKRSFSVPSAAVSTGTTTRSAPPAGSLFTAHPRLRPSRWTIRSVSWFLIAIPRPVWAYYLGVFSLIPCLGLPLAIAAIVMGMRGLKAFEKNPEVRGRAHALVGVIVGGFIAVAYVALLVWIVAQA